jgi:hypothetical protein
VAALSLASFLPDLTVSNVNASYSFRGTSQGFEPTLTVSWTEANIGGGSASSNWFDAVYVSSNATLDASATLVGMSSFGSQYIAPGMSASQIVTFDNPSGVGSGEYLLVQANSLNYLWESNTNNNVAALSLASFLPDLTVSNLTAVLAGTSATLSWTEVNIGGGGASSNWYDAVYLSTKATLDASAQLLELPSYPNQYLAPGSSVLRSNITVSLPVFQPGTNYLLVQANYYNELWESSTNNNVASVVIAIIEPDLIATNLIALTLVPNNGGALTVAWMEANEDNSTATGQWVDGLYFSATPYLTSQSTLLTNITYSNQSLATNASVNRTNVISNLPPLVEGNNYLLVWVNDQNTIPELNVSNNVAAIFLGAVNTNATGGSGNGPCGMNFELVSSLTGGGAPYSVVAADVNGDGKPDLICANNYATLGLPNPNTLFVFTNDGRGGFTLSAILPTGIGATRVIAADLNNDGKADLVCAAYSDDTLTVWFNDGSGGFVNRTDISVRPPLMGKMGPIGVAAADVNGDGKLDLVSANEAGNSLTVLTNDGHGGFTMAAYLEVGHAAEAVTAADVNGDGKIDLISVNENDSTLTILTNDGRGGFVVASTPSVGNGPAAVVATDVNGDGKLDLVTANARTNTLSVLTNDGTGRFTLASSPTVGNGPYGPYGVTAADLNGDGSMDLVSANQSANSLTVLTNDGFGNFTLAATLGVGAVPRDVVAVDVNGDGRLDLVSADWGGNTLSVLFDQPIQSFFSQEEWLNAIGTTNGTTNGLTVFSFDGPTELNETYANSTSIAPSYASQGVVFLPFTGSSVYPFIERGQQYQISASNHDGLMANNDSPNPTSDLEGRAIKFNFIIPVQSFGLFFNGPLNGGDYGYLEVFDGSTNLIGRTDVCAPGGFVGMTCCQNIAQVHVVNTGNSDIQFGIWDLQFPPVPIVSGNPPVLSIRIVNTNNVEIAWPTNANGFSLQSARNLSPLSWNPVPQTPVVFGTNFIVTNSILPGAEYYRLKK